jgi:hypothetical protein
MRTVESRTAAVLRRYQCAPEDLPAVQAFLQAHPGRLKLLEALPDQVIRLWGPETAATLRLVPTIDPEDGSEELVVTFAGTEVAADEARLDQLDWEQAETLLEADGTAHITLLPTYPAAAGHGH